MEKTFSEMTKDDLHRYYEERLKDVYAMLKQNNDYIVRLQGEHDHLKRQFGLK